MTRITAPMLDELLGRLTPELLTELQAAMPAGYAALADQVVAAQAQSVELMEHVENDRVGWVRRTDVGGWIRLGVLDALLAWIDGTARTCMHMPDHRRPQPVFSCAWKPGLVVCVQCLHLLDVVGAADATCDRCGHICEGVYADDAIYTGTVWVGALAFQFGTCADCRPELGAAA